MALLIGPAFIFFYSTVSLPLGRLADRWNRKVLIVGGILFWSVCTGLFGVAGSFAVLFLARMGVGLGEAALVPSGVSILGDMMPRDRLGRAVSIFTGGGILGGATATALGGILLGWLTSVGHAHIPLVGQAAPWQQAFLILALPGLVVGALAAFTLPEPARVRDVTSTGSSITIRRTIGYLWANRRGTLVPLLGFALISTASGVSTWMATFYIRTFGLTPMTVGTIMGFTSIIVGFPGAVTGGTLVDILRKRGREDANLIVAIGALLFEIPLSFIILNISNPWICFALAVPSAFFLIMAFSVAHSAVALSVPSTMRAQAVAFYLLCANGIGIGIVPLVVALLTDQFFGDPLWLRYSMMTVIACVMPFTIVILAISRAPYRQQSKGLKALEARELDQ
jgi:MFS family permease